LGLARTLGVDASFLLYREPAYLNRLQGQGDQALSQYLKEHRASWAKTLVEYTDSSACKRDVIRRGIARSDLRSLYNGVAKLSEELIVYVFQAKALAGLKISQLEKTEREPEFQRRFATDLTKSWPKFWCDFAGIGFWSHAVKCT